MKFTRKTVSLGAVALAAVGALSAPVAAWAVTPVFGSPGGLTGPHGAGAPVNLGLSFTANSSAWVDALGAYAPFTGSETVTLYTSGGAPLASAVVQDTDPVTGGYHFAAITPVQLTAGQSYVVSVQVGNNAWYYSSPTQPTVLDPAVSFVGTSYLYGAAVAFPTSTFFGANGGYYGPNLSVSAVPEPSAYALGLAGLGVLALIGRRRRSS